MPALICLAPVAIVVFVVGVAYLAANLQSVIHNRNAMIRAEKARIRKTTARRLIEIKKRKNGL